MTTETPAAVPAVDEVERMAQAAIATYSPADAAIADLRERYLPLTVDGIDDREGLDRVHKARMIVKAHRVSIEKTRKDLKAGALEYGRRVDGEAKRLTAMLEPIEEHLRAEEDRVAEEKARLKAEEEARRKAKLDERVAALAAVGYQAQVSVVDAMTDADFEEEMVYRAQQQNERKEREAREEDERRRAEEVRKAEEAAERERMAKERAELERQRAEQKAAELKAAAEQRAAEERLAKERAAVEEERRRVQAERDDVEREKELERARQEAAAKAKADAEAEAKRKEEEAKAREKAEAEEHERREAAKPEAEQLVALASVISDLRLPKLPSTEKHVREMLERVERELLAMAKELMR